MTTYGIVVEGEYDKEALSELIQKCISNGVKIIARPFSGKGKLIKKFPGFLTEFCHKSVDKALIIRDADNKNPDKLLEEMRRKIKDLNYPFEVRFIVIVQELETWLLADQEAISKVTKSRSGRTVSGVNENLESIIQPKERLEGILSGAKVYYTPEVAREIAKESDISRIEYRCPRFREFRLAVIDC